MPRRHVRNALIPLCVLASAPLAAQDAPPAPLYPAPIGRSGFYTSAGIGWGYADENCTGSSCYAATTGANGGWSGYFGAGGTISRQYRFGFEADLSSVTANGSTQKLGFFNLMLTLYPKLASNLWLKAGLGYVSNSTHLNGSSTSVGGFGGGLGVGFDMMPGNGAFALIPYAMYMAQISGATPDVYSDATLKAHLFQIGVGLGYKH